MYLTHNSPCGPWKTDGHDREIGGDSDGINGSSNEQKVKSGFPSVEEQICIERPAKPDKANCPTPEA